MVTVRPDGIACGDRTESVGRVPRYDYRGVA